MASESLFSVKRMLKEIKEKLSVSSGGSGTELTLGEVVEELKSTVESLQTTVNTVNTTVTEIKNSPSGLMKEIYMGYINFNAESTSSNVVNNYVEIRNLNGYVMFGNQISSPYPTVNGNYHDFKNHINSYGSAAINYKYEVVGNFRIRMTNTSTSTTNLAMTVVNYGDTPIEIKLGSNKVVNSLEKVSV